MLTLLWPNYIDLYNFNLQKIKNYVLNIGYILLINMKITLSCSIFTNLFTARVNRDSKIVLNDYCHLHSIFRKLNLNNSPYFL